MFTCSLHRRQVIVIVRIMYARSQLLPKKSVFLKQSTGTCASAGTTASTYAYKIYLQLFYYVVYRHVYQERFKFTACVDSASVTVYPLAAIKYRSC
jgi:hypothetical protein